MPAAVGRLSRLEIDNTIRATVAAFAEPTLRSLDAIHLATAQVLTNKSGSELPAFVTQPRPPKSAFTTFSFPLAQRPEPKANRRPIIKDGGSHARSTWAGRCTMRTTRPSSPATRFQDV